MPDRHPIAAGRFYPAEPQALRAEIGTWFAQGKTFAEATPLKPTRRTLDSLRGLMLPHAGYIYCGNVIGATLASHWNGTSAGAALPERLVALCPNHTGRGAALGVWPEGHWHTPLGSVPVDEELAAALCGHGGFAPDVRSHQEEHSIEVLLPFLQCLPAPEGKPEAARRITPICVGTRRPEDLLAAGLALAETVRACASRGEKVGFIVSSDMNHYENQEATMHKDALALSQVLACDPDGLLAMVERDNISMCGAGPMALALFAAHALGEPWASLCLYDTSASASGDTQRVVGYAGLCFGMA